MPLSGTNLLLHLVVNGDTGVDIQFLFDVIDLTTANETPGSIFTADIRKTFDSLNWDFMFRVVVKYCFESTVFKWIKTFYTMPVRKIAISNFYLKNFRLVAVSDKVIPCPPTLFILCIECLASTLRDSHLFNGLKIGGLCKIGGLSKSIYVCR